MKQLKNIMLILSILILPLAVSGQAGAASLSVQHEITVTAIVLPVRTVIVDSRGVITEITSNTELDVTPVVYLDVVAAGNEQRLVAGVYDQYRQLVPPGTGDAGVLYERTTLSVLGIDSPQLSAAVIGQPRLLSSL